MVEYSYDAWGNHTIKAYNKTVANANPFRYRSYFYDTDTKLYYLQTRYYDPEVGRFLNMDAVDNADPETLGGLNLYSYCNNNPVMYVDHNGKSMIAIFLLLAATTLAGAIIGGKVAADQNKKGWDLVAAVILGAAIGLAVGGAAVALTGVVAGAIGGASATVFGGVAAKTAFSIGALAFDFTAFIIAPLYGISMQGIEYETPKPIPIPQKPQPTPPHPYNNKNRRMQSSFNEM